GVVRALYCAVRSLEAASRRRTRGQNEGSNNAGKPWTEEEDRQLLSAFDGGRPLAQLAPRPGPSRNWLRRTAAPVAAFRRGSSAMAGSRLRAVGRSAGPASGDMTAPRC